MPPERSRTRSTKRAGVEQGRPVGEPGRRDGRRALRQAAHLGDPARRPCCPGRWPPVPVFAPWPSLRCSACTRSRHVLVPAEPARRQLVEVARALGLLLGQHPALAGADRGARALGAAGERGLGLRPRARRSSCRRRRPGCRSRSGLAAAGPIVTVGVDRLVVEQREAVQLRGERTAGRPSCGSSVAGHAHRGDGRRAAPARPLRGELVDLRDERLLGGVLVRVVEEPVVGRRDAAARGASIRYVDQVGLVDAALAVDDAAA